MPILLDGEKTAQIIKNELKEEIKKAGLRPGLAVVLVGKNPASRVYVRHKKKACAEVGIKSFSYELPAETTQYELMELIEKLNLNKKIHGILVQLPLPEQINEQKIIQSVDPKKDVDGFHPLNAGRLMLGLPGFRPATPLGIIELIKRYNLDLVGQHAVIVGRSNIVGKPLFQLLLSEHATVTMCHSKTKNLLEITKQADILVAALGQPRFIKKNMVKKGAVIIDVGINRLRSGKLVGDVDFDKVKNITEAITPVPGGVGPMTIAALLINTVEAAGCIH
ncbi:bifunctional methylenetetrahydrofolate dehydrogenase/methenyltetrahydrofolate cyclohydrolase FolD [Candidatus Parcubacteria bacterium]|nr:bifunctional methylenetetrahydrofolate dehydrogenase/methenyltetrahydrofolate cyclohydrolase FolD [Candidatus Parcubacteria bacterium]